MRPAALQSGISAPPDAPIENLWHYLKSHHWSNRAYDNYNALKRCRDCSEVGFERYLSLAILGRNLHTLGRLLIAQEAPTGEAALTRRKAA